MRQDIVDELADHLACAVRREMVAGSDEQSAWVKTLEKFGDPRLVARRLWWQAMRSRIMSQRLSLVVQVCTLAACAALVFVAWQMQEGQRTQQEAFLAALAKLTEPRETKPATPPETRLAVQLKTSSPDQKFPEPASLTIRGTHLSNNEVRSERYFGPESGLIDFGRIPPGAYSLGLQTQFGYSTRQIEVNAGESHVEEFTLPNPEEPIELKFDLHRPMAISQQDWDNSGLVTFAAFERLPITTGTTKWMLSPDIVKFAIGDTIKYWSVPLDSLSQLNSPSERVRFAGIVNSDWTSQFEQKGAGAGSLTLPRGTQYRLIRLGIITNPDRFRTRGKGSTTNTAPIAVIWDSSHSDFPAWAKAEGNVFVADNDSSPLFNQQMFPWRIDIPDAMANEVLAQIKQNAEFDAATVVEKREAAEKIANMLAAKERASRGPTQNRVRIRFVEGTKEGPAVRPHQVSLVLPGSAKPLTPVVDETGGADFGYLDAGLYSLEVQLSSGAAMSHSFVVHPQKDYEETIVCPPEPKPIFTRKFLVQLSEDLRNQGIEAYIEWEWQTPDAERWDGWRLASLSPFAKANEDAKDVSQLRWTVYTELNKSDETAVVGEYNIRAMRIRPKLIRLSWPRPNEAGVSVILGQSRLRDQPWVDVESSDDDPIVINLPSDLLLNAKTQLQKFTPLPNEEADAPGANPLPQ